MENKEKVNCPECDKYFATKYTLGVHKLRKHNNSDGKIKNTDYTFKDYVDKKITKVRHDRVTSAKPNHVTSAKPNRVMSAKPNVAEYIDLKEDLDNIRDESDERDELLNENLFIACDKIYRVLERISEHLKIDISDITASNNEEQKTDIDDITTSKTDIDDITTSN